MNSKIKSTEIYSKETERAFLGSVLMDPSVLKQINGKLKPEHFYYKKHKVIFQTILDMIQGGKIVDLVTLTNRLKEIDKLEEVGGAYEISGLNDECPSAANAPTYAKIIKNYSLERAKIRVGQRFAQGEEKAEMELQALITDDGSLPSFNESDAGNAEMLAHLYGDKIRYNHTTGIWLIWNGQYWKPDDRKELNEFVKKSARVRAKDSLSIIDTSIKKVSVNYAIRSEDQYKVSSCINSAKSIPTLATTNEQWDDDPIVIQFENGTFVLSTMELKNGEPKWMISKSTGYDYDFTADCPIWKKSILEIMDSKPEMVLFIQRALGYSLFGETVEQCFFLMWGSGSNGKSKFQDLMNLLFGDYARATQFQIFERKHNRSNSNDVARLAGVRFVYANESGEAKRFDEERIKSLVHGDRQTARFLNKEFFEFVPRFKLWLSVNTLPKVSDFSDGFWRSVMLIPFNASFKGESDDKYILDKWKNELQGIMNWILKGAESWMAQGLNPPEEVLQATSDYHNESDIVAQFVDACIELDTSGIIPAKQLYLHFIEWHDDNYSEKPMSQQMFGRRIKVLGHGSEKIGSSRKYLGIKLIRD